MQAVHLLPMTLDLQVQVPSESHVGYFDPLSLQSQADNMFGLII